MDIVEVVTLKFHHGGLFKKTERGLQYVGGEVRTFEVDVDELCWFYLKELAIKCGGYREIDEIYYLLPHSALDEGLKRVYADREVMEMAGIVVDCRTIDLYVLHAVDTPEILPMTTCSVPGGQMGRKKLTPKKKAQPTKKDSPQKNTPTKKVGPHSSWTPLRSSPRFTSTQVESTPSCSQSKINQESTPLYFDSQPLHVPLCSSKPHQFNQPLDEEYYQWYDNRPDSPIPLNELISDYDSSDESDPPYEPQSESDVNKDDSGSGTSLDDEIDVDREQPGIEDVVGDAGDSSDDELKEAREKKRRTDAELIALAEKLQKEAAGGKVGRSSTETHEQEGDGYESEYADSDGAEDSPEEDFENDLGIQRRRSTSLTVGENTNWETFTWRVGQRFPNREAFKRAVIQFAIYQGRNISFVTSNRNRQQRLQVKCLPGCKFRVYGSWDKNTACFLVKSVESGHCCTRNMEKNKQLKSTWLAQHFLEIFKSKPHWPAKEIVECVKRAFRVVIKKDVAYKVKYRAHRLLHGSMKQHYLKVGGYLELIKQTSPNTKLSLVKDEDTDPPVFKRMFVCFDGVSKGWIEGCRRVLCIDACFLKTFLGGQLLAAVGRDGNDQMFPVAWAVVEGENNDSWEWFLTEVRNCLALTDGRGVAVISDEHQAILYAVQKVLPHAEHRHCARHIYAHWHKGFRGDEFKMLFWRAAKAYNVADYNDALEDMEKVNPAAVDAFKSYNPRLFCRAFMDTDTKVDVVVNNLAETFNGYIITARTKHLLYMLEEIRTALMQRLAVKKKEMEASTGIVCPRIALKLEKNKKEAADCYVVPSTATVFQVNHKMDVLHVDLESRSCTCRRWDLTGIPCSHAVSCIFFCHQNAEDYVAHWYKKDTYLKSYASSIPPCVGERHWPKVDLPLNPPPIKIGPGRPRKNRIKDPFEDPKKPGRLTKHGLQMTCSVCKSTKHNKRRCPDKDKAVEPQPKSSRMSMEDMGPSQQLSHSEKQPENSNDVHDATAQPSRTGKGGRVIRSGKGSRGGVAGRGAGGAGRGRGGGGAARGRAAGGAGRGASVVHIVGGNGRGRGRAGVSVGRGRSGGRVGGSVGRGRTGGRVGGASVPNGVGVFVAADGTSIVNTPGMPTPMDVTQQSSTAQECPIGSQGSTN